MPALIEEIYNDLRDNPVFEKIVCPVCGGADQKPYFQVRYGDLKQKESYNYSVLGIGPETALFVEECGGCGFVFVNPRIRAEHAHLIYNEGKKGDAQIARRKEAVNPKNIRRNATYFTLLMRLMSCADPKQTPTLLDIGAGFGHTLDAAKALGIDGTGVDADAGRVTFCKNKGLDVYSLDEFAVRKNHAVFDMIAVQSVIEHVIDLPSFMKFISGVSRKGTALYVNGLLPKIIWHEKRKGRFVKAHFVEHVNYFTFKTLDRLLVQYGFYPARRNVLFINSRSVPVPDYLYQALRRLASRSKDFERIYIKRH